MKERKVDGIKIDLGLRNIMIKEDWHGSRDCFLRQFPKTVSGEKGFLGDAAGAQRHRQALALERLQEAFGDGQPLQACGFGEHAGGLV